MTGSHHIHQTLSELHSINREHDEQLPHGVAASRDGFSVYAAVLNALQRHSGLETSTQETMKPEHLSDRMRGLDPSRSIFSDSRHSSHQYTGKLALAGLASLQGLSVGPREERIVGSTWQDEGHDDYSRYARKIGTNRRKKQLTKSQLIKKINQSLKKINYQEEFIKKNIIKLGKKRQEAKKLLRKKSSQTVMSKKKINNIISQFKQEEKTAKKHLDKLEKKGHKTKKSLKYLLSKNSHGSDKINRIFKKIGHSEKIKQKNHIKLKNHRIIKALLRNAKQKRLFQEKQPKHALTICLANPLNSDRPDRAHNASRVMMTPRKKYPVLRGGGKHNSQESRGGVLGSFTRGTVRTLAIQASMTPSSARSPLFSPCRENTTVDTSNATTQNRVTVAAPYRGSHLANRQDPVVPVPNSSAHDLAYSTYNPKNSVVDQDIDAGNLNHGKQEELKVTQSSTIQDDNTDTKKETVQKRPKINHIMHKKCKAVANLLLKNGFISHDANYKSHPEALLYGVIDFIKKQENGKKILAGVLQKADDHHHTEKLVDPLSEEAYQDSIVNHWINQLVFEKNADEFIIEVFVNLERIHQFASDKPSENIMRHLQDIKKRIEKIIEKKFSKSKQHEYFMMDIKKYIINNIIEPLFPIMNKNIKKSFSFVELGYLNAGYQLEKTYTGNITITADEALSIGKMLYLQVAEGAVNPLFRKNFFKIISLFHYATNNLDRIHQYFSNAKDRKALEEKALDSYFNEIEKHNKQEDDKNQAISESVSTLNELLNQYKTRTQLSDDILKKQCPRKDQTDHLNGDNYCVTKVEYPALPQMGLPHYYGHPIEDATENFNHQNNKLLNQASKVHYLIFNSLFNNLSNENKRFITASEVKGLTVHLEITEEVKYINRPATYDRPASYSYGDKKFGYSQHHFPTVKQLFVANNNGRKKYFLTIIEKNEYSIIEIDNTIENYYKLLKKNEPFNKEKSHYLEIHEGEVLKNPQDSIKKLADNIFNKKERELLKRYFHDQGYDETFLEKFKEILLDLIPFRDCVNLLTEGKFRAGIASCVLDVFSIIPLVQVGSRIVLTSAKVVGKGGAKTFLDFSISGARNSLKNGMVIVGRNTIDTTLELVNIAKKNIIPLGKELIRVVDPGVELVIDSISSSIKQALKLGCYMQDNIPNLKNALDKIKNKPGYKENELSLKNLYNNFNPEMIRPKSKIIGDEFSKIDGLKYYNVKLENLKHQTIADRDFIYDVTDRDKILEIKNINNKFYVEGTPCVHTGTRIIKRGANCVKGKINLEGIEKVEEIKNMIFSVKKIKINYGIKNSEKCEEMANLVRESLRVEENILLETRGIGLWGDIEGKVYENHFVVKVTLKKTGEIFIIDVINGIVASERNWIAAFLKDYEGKEFFIQYADFKSTNHATIEFPVFSPNTPLPNIPILKEPDWYYEKLKDYSPYYLNNDFYGGKLVLKQECIKNDLMMMSKQGLEINKDIYLNNNWLLEKININSKPYVDGNQLGSEISVSFYLNYKNQGTDFVEIPQLRWDEQLKVNSVSEGDWLFPMTNRYDHHFQSPTFFVWRNRYSLAYDSVMRKPQTGERIFVQLMDKNGKKVNAKEFKKVSNSEEKTKQVTDYLKNNGGQLKITIVDLPKVRFKNEVYERKIDFSIGFGNNNELATFTQGIVENGNADRIAFVTTSKDVSVAERFDPQTSVPEKGKNVITR